MRAALISWFHISRALLVYGQAKRRQSDHGKKEKVGVSHRPWNTASRAESVDLGFFKLGGKHKM